MKKRILSLGTIFGLFLFIIAPLAAAQEPATTLLPRGSIEIEVEEALENGGVPE